MEYKFSVDRPLGLELEDLVVHDIVPGSQAEELNVKPGCRIVEINGEQPPSAAQCIGAGGPWVRSAVALAREMGPQLRIRLACAAPKGSTHSESAGVATTAANSGHRIARPAAGTPTSGAIRPRGRHAACRPLYWAQP